MKKFPLITKIKNDSKKLINDLENLCKDFLNLYLYIKEKNFKKFQFLLLFFVASVSIGLSAYILSANLYATWGIIDDHTGIKILGSDGKIQFSDMPFLLRNSDLGHWGSSIRFRPSFSLLRIVEAWIWGDRVEFWYLARIIMASICLFSFWIFFRKIIGFFLGGITAISIYTQFYWYDIFSRLWAAEDYAAFSLPIFLLSYYTLFSRRKELLDISEYVWWIVFTLSSFITIGAKENMIFLVFPIFYLFFKSKRKIFPFICMISIFLYSFWIILGLIIAFLQSPYDVYENSVNIIDRIKILILSFNNKPILILGIIFIFLIVLYLVFYKKKSLVLKRVTSLIRINIFLVLLLWLMVLFQYILYNNNLSQSPRYSFPMMLYVPSLLILFIYTTRSLFKIYRIKIIWKALTFLVIFVSIFLYVWFNGFKTVIFFSRINAENTQNFEKSLSLLKREASIDKNIPFVFESTNIKKDYEPIESLRIFLSYLKIRNPFYIRIQGYSVESLRTPLEKSLYSHIEDLSIKGTVESNDSGDILLNAISVYPIQKLKSPCVSLYLTDDALNNSVCDTVIKINVNL